MRGVMGTGRKAVEVAELESCQPTGDHMDSINLVVH